MKRCAAKAARLLTARRTDTHDGTLNDVPTQTQAQPGCHKYIGNKIENLCMCTWRGKKASAASLLKQREGVKVSDKMHREPCKKKRKKQESKSFSPSSNSTLNETKGRESSYGQRLPPRPHPLPLAALEILASLSAVLSARSETIVSIRSFLPLYLQPTYLSNISSSSSSSSSSSVSKGASAGRAAAAANWTEIKGGKKNSF